MCNIKGEANANISANFNESDYANYIIGQVETKSAAETLFDRFSTLKSNHTDCELGWSSVNLTTGQFCYFFNMSLANRDDTLDLCRKMGSKLPLPASLADDRRIRALVPATGRISGSKVGGNKAVWINAIFKETD